MRFAVLLSILLAATAAAAPCFNCDGHRVVGPGPVLYACPICHGAGELDDSPSGEDDDSVSAAPDAAPAPPAAMLRCVPIESAPSPAVAGRPRPVVARVIASTGPSRSTGSGVLVAASGTSGLVLTAWHVVRGSRDAVSVRWPDGSQSPARVVAGDDAWDLAALLVARPAATPVTLAATAPRVAEPLTIAGYGPPPFRYREQRGQCSDYLAPSPRHPRQFVELFATARQGDSGGPIFDARGELAGVLFAENGGRTIGSCSTRLRIFLAGVQWPDDGQAVACCAEGVCR